MLLTREELKEIIKDVLKEVMVEEGIIKQKPPQGISTRYSIGEENGIGPTTKYGIKTP